MSTEQEVLYRNEDGEITVTNTMLSWPRTHVPIRNITSVSLKTGFPVQHLNKLKIASFVVMGLGGLGLIGGDPTLLMLGILMFIWYWFCPAAVAINAGGTPSIINKSTVRKSGAGQEKLLEAINQAIMNIQDR